MFPLGCSSDAVGDVACAWSVDQLNCMYGVSVTVDDPGDHQEQKEKEMN